MITKREVKHIAKLARLGLAPKEIGKLQRELSTIFDYMEKLKEVDVSGVTATSHSVEIENVMRGDEKVQKTQDRAVRKLLELAPETTNGYLRVKSIL